MLIGATTSKGSLILPSSRDFDSSPAPRGSTALGVVPLSEVQRKPCRPAQAPKQLLSVNGQRRGLHDHNHSSNSNRGKDDAGLRAETSRVKKSILGWRPSPKDSHDTNESKGQSQPPSLLHEN